MPDAAVEQTPRDREPGEEQDRPPAHPGTTGKQRDSKESHRNPASLAQSDIHVEQSLAVPRLWAQPRTGVLHLRLQNALPPSSVVPSYGWFMPLFAYLGVCGDIYDFDVHGARKAPATSGAAAEHPLRIVQSAVLDELGQARVVGDVVELLRDDHVEQRVGDVGIELRALVRFELVKCRAVTLPVVARRGHRLE